MDKIEHTGSEEDVDYRSSHLQKSGEDYDRELERGDFDTYMAVHEAELLESIVKRLYPRGVPRYLDFACGSGVDR